MTSSTPSAHALTGFEPGTRRAISSALARWPSRQRLQCARPESKPRALAVSPRRSLARDLLNPGLPMRRHLSRVALDPVRSLCPGQHFRWYCSRQSLLRRLCIDDTSSKAHKGGSSEGAPGYPAPVSRAPAETAMRALDLRSFREMSKALCGRKRRRKPHRR